MPADGTYRPRLVDETLRRLLEQAPAVLVVGPRAAGKTTTASRHAASVVRLDQEREAAVFRADPDAALRQFDEPTLLDEWQNVPGVLGAVKRTVDTDPRPGRFILTGSVSAEHDPATWPGVGRLIRLHQYGMTQRELQGDLTEPSLLHRLWDDELPTTQTLADAPDLPGYISLALTGTFPEPTLLLDEAGQERWFLTYAEQIVGRDVSLLGSPDVGRMNRFLETEAASTAGVVSDATLCDMAGIDRRTVARYEGWLTNLHVLDVVPAWASRRVTRLVRTPKRYLIDPALAAAILGADRRTVLTDGELIGRLLDTFVAAQLRPELASSSPLARMHHLRQEQGRREVDVVIEAGGSVVGVEIKATASPSAESARHLVWLRDQLGDRFRAGAVLHTGPGCYELADRIMALPIAALWLPLITGSAR